MDIIDGRSPGTYVKATEQKSQAIKFKQPRSLRKFQKGRIFFGLELGELLPYTLFCPLYPGSTDRKWMMLNRTENSSAFNTNCTAISILPVDDNPTFSAVSDRVKTL